MRSRHRPIFPGSHPPSIFGTDELNYCVRDGNRWDLIAISTGLDKGQSLFKTPLRIIILPHLQKLVKSVQKIPSLSKTRRDFKHHTAFHPRSFLIYPFFGHDRLGCPIQLKQDHELLSANLLWAFCKNMPPLGEKSIKQQSAQGIKLVFMQPKQICSQRVDTSQTPML